ncbi:MAG TPA: hypothetical protein VGF43_16115 [Dongiaceae bacterium]|jgi:hypothetical protein
MTDSDLTYDDWINYVFDHAVPFYEQAWYWNADEDWWQPRPEQAIDYLTRLFENPEPLTDQFADSQIAQGLHYLIDNAAGAHCRFLSDGSVRVEARIACIASMQTLFARIFQPRCEPVLSHLDEPGANALNRICYMWWDVAPLGATSKPSRPDPVHDACLSVMRETLKLPNPACQENALHGLGHWAHAYGEFTAAAIDGYLARNPKLRPELVRYAQAARSGCIQ